MQRMAREIINNEQSIVERVNDCQTNSEEKVGETKTITLLDIFDFVDSNNYPQLWQQVLKTVSLFPTTVSCEQSFCRLRNKLHENMNKETAFSFLSMTQKKHSFIFDKTRTGNVRGLGNPGECI